jgi:glycosyltransferase involved in cell wall biosynthesis
MSLDPSLFPKIAPVAGTSPRPFWSVIVPAYRGEFLGQAIRSVLEQDPGRDQMEILVIDDCSPEELEPIVSEAGGDRIAFHRNPSNLGTYATENAGISMSRGMWIHVLNDDDWVLNGFYEAFQESLKGEESVAAACCRCRHVDDSGAEISDTPLLSETAGVLKDWLSRIGQRNLTHPVSTVVQRRVYEHVGGYYQNLNSCSDWDLNKRAALFYDWWYEPRVLACYRAHSKGVTAQAFDTGEQMRDFGHAIELAERYLPPDRREQISTAAREHYAAYGLKTVVAALEANDLPRAIRQIQATLDLCSSDRVLEMLANLITQPSARPLRRMLPQIFRKITLVKAPKSDAEAT